MPVRTPGSISVVRPLRDGVITDFDLCEAMLRYFMRKSRPQRFAALPRVLVAAPASITPVEKRAIYNSALRAGAELRVGRARLAHEPVHFELLAVASVVRNPAEPHRARRMELHLHREVEVARHRAALDVQLGPDLAGPALIVAFEHLDRFDHFGVPTRIPVDRLEQCQRLLKRCGGGGRGAPGQFLHMVAELTPPSRSPATDPWP